jgi:transcriptional regulator with XRE-family HTH domain
MNATLDAMPKGTALPSLKRVRIQKSFSQADLARAADLAERTVVYAEAGNGVSLRTTRKLAQALDVQPDELRAEPETAL